MEALDFAPGFTYARERLADAYLQLGRFDEAIAESQSAAAGGGAREAAALAYAYATAGRQPEAIAILEELVRGDRYLAPTHMAMAYAALGETEQALSWLERGVAQHDPHVTGLLRLHAFRKMQSHPGVAALARTMGLTA
jgi:tetratricopeptide (TPR) repeat protein